MPVVRLVDCSGLTSKYIYCLYVYISRPISIIKCLGSIRMLCCWPRPVKWLCPDATLHLNRSIFISISISIIIMGTHNEFLQIACAYPPGRPCNQRGFPMVIPKFHPPRCHRSLASIIVSRGAWKYGLVIRSIGFLMMTVLIRPHK